MKKLLNFKKYILSLALVLVLASFFIGYQTNAGLADAVSGIVGHIISFFIWILGGILFVLIYILIWVAQYNDFVNADAVENGWVIVRDLCNMFFILILLIIAFATILRIESYNAKKLLPKLLIMAVLINFSKTICGLIIDFAQVIMLTFVNGFKEMGGANLTTMLGIDKILAINVDAAKDVGLLSVVGSYLLALLYTIISVIVVLVIVAVLVMRMVMLWVYIVLSPLAYLLSAFPAGHKYSQQWWSEFSKNVIVGPVLAFFIWLSFISLGSGADPMGSTPVPGMDVKETKKISEMGEKSETERKEGKAPQAGIAEAGQPADMIKFIVSIGMLIGGLMVTQQIGGIAGNIAGKGMAAIQKGKGLALKGAALPFRGMKEAASFGIDKLQQKTGVDLNVGRVWQGIKEKRAEIRAERYGEGMQKARDVMATRGRLYGALAMTGTSGTAWEQITSTKGIMQRIRGGKRMTAMQDKLSPGLEEAKFKSDFAIKSGDERHDGIFKLRDKSLELKRQIAAETDDEKRKEFEKEQQKTERQFNWAQETHNSIDPYDEDKAKLKVKDYSDKAKEKQMEFNKYKPMYDFEARAVEQKLVGAKMSKIKDITDASELLSILQEAIKGHDKTMVKAITKKMALNYDDNEFLQPLAGGTDFKALQRLMKGLADEKNTDLYAGFSGQEAMALGSEISMINKGTNHWAATGAYAMENGRWKEMSEPEHNAFRQSEVGKMHPQSRARSLNRLGYGGHDGTGAYHLDIGGIMTLKTFDSAAARKQFEGNLPESTAKFLWTPESQEKIEKAVRNKILSPELRDIIKNAAVAGITDHEAEFLKIKKALET